MRGLKPDIYLNHVSEVSPDLLHKRGIRALILDVDNTLTRHNSQVLSKEVADWVALMRQNGMKLMIASNNTAARIEPFSKTIGIDAIPNSCKPLPIGYRKAQKEWNLPSHEIAVIGDQIYTDITGANLCGMLSIMVNCFEPEKNVFFKFKRFLERPVLKHYRKIGESAFRSKGGTHR